MTTEATRKERGGCSVRETRNTWCRPDNPFRFCQQNTSWKARVWNEFQALYKRQILLSMSLAPNYRISSTQTPISHKVSIIIFLSHETAHNLIFKWQKLSTFINSSLWLVFIPVLNFKLSQPQMKFIWIGRKYNSSLHNFEYSAYYNLNLWPIIKRNWRQ